MNTEPSSGGYRWVTTTFQTSSNETWMIFASNLLIASSFVSGALSGTITVHGICFWRACQASAWAMFPALQVYTPRFFASGPARARALLAPRTLKDPVGCRFSSFRKISAGASSAIRCYPSTLKHQRYNGDLPIRMKKEAVKTGRAPLGLPFSPALRFGELLFVS